MLGVGSIGFPSPKGFFLSLKTRSVVRSAGASTAIVRANQRAAHSMNDKNTPINTLSQEAGQICSRRDMMIG